MGPEAARQIENVACTVCGCVCDDLRITVEGERIVRAEGACQLAEPWFLSQGSRQPPMAEIDEKPVALDAALERAADDPASGPFASDLWPFAQRHHRPASGHRPGRPHRRDD